MCCIKHLCIFDKLFFVVRNNILRIWSYQYTGPTSFLNWFRIHTPNTLSGGRQRRRRNMLIVGIPTFLAGQADSKGMSLNLPASTLVFFASVDLTAKFQWCNYGVQPAPPFTFFTPFQFKQFSHLPSSLYSKICFKFLDCAMSSRVIIFLLKLRTALEC